MIFLGGGGMLSQAVIYALHLDLKVDGVCCQIGDPCVPKLKKFNISILETNKPNIDLIPMFDKLSDAKVFSINNKFILEDQLLASGPLFFNIHNGLIQNYRGVAEVCIFAAICKGETKYGVTLHQILPNQKVDCGPVIDQLKFTVTADDDFSAIMKKSLNYCQKIFEDNVESIIGNRYKKTYFKLSNITYSYKDLPTICSASLPHKLIKASNFGYYEPYFAKLVQFVDASYKSKK